jgi:hypothetical protein
MYLREGTCWHDPDYQPVFYDKRDKDLPAIQAMKRARQYDDEIAKKKGKGKKTDE